MNNGKKLNFVRNARKARVRAKIKGSGEKPRLSIFRSNTHIYAQIIDDATRKTLLSASSLDIAGKGAKTKKSTKTETAQMVGAALGKKAKEAGIKHLVFDRGAYRYHGRVKALAEAVKTEGIQL